MRYRTLSPEGDYVFGQGSQQFLANTPETVAQAVRTRLALMTGEWFLDSNEGTPYATKILGAGTTGLYDQVIRERILDTQGVRSIEKYVSVLTQDRHLQIACTLNTIYGRTELVQSL